MPFVAFRGTLTDADMASMKDINRLTKGATKDFYTSKFTRVGKQ
jgi:hypothetical protein